MTSNKQVQTGKGNAINVQAIPKNFQAINAPKLNTLTIASNGLKAIAETGFLNTAKAKKACGYTPLGHENGHKGAIIDYCLLKGCYSAQHYVDALLKSNIKAVQADIAVFGYGDNLNAWLTKRVIDHLKWQMNVENKTHKGFYDRLCNVNLEKHHATIANCIGIIYNELCNQFAVRFQGHYKKAQNVMTEHKAKN